MTAAAGNREVYTPGPFGDSPTRTMCVKELTLSRAEGQLQEVLGTFERLGERGLCDDLTTFIDLVIDRMGEVAQEASAA